MIITKPYHEFMAIDSSHGIGRLIERAGRTCYKSESRATDTSADAFVRGIIASGHHSVIEHASATVRIVCDRGVSHELVRHRLASYSQESTRYANYAGGRFGGQITVVLPLWYDGVVPTGCHPSSELAVLESQLYNSDGRAVFQRAARWLTACLTAERSYLAMIADGAAPQEARSVLPNSLKTEVVMTANLREWKHVLSLRCAKAAHPQIREIMMRLLEDFYHRVPAVFGDEYTRFIVGSGQGQRAGGRGVACG